MKESIYLVLTQLTVVVHMAFILFVVIGGFFVFRNKWLLFVHLASLIWAVYVELTPGLICPLTSMENYFAYHAGLATYEDDFITRYLVPIIYQENLTPKIQLLLAIGVIGINAVAYGYSWKRTRA